MDETIGRYPNGFRQYENYNAYKYYNRDATIQDYIEIMNSPVEFE